MTKSRMSEVSEGLYQKTYGNRLMCGGINATRSLFDAHLGRRAAQRARDLCTCNLEVTAHLRALSAVDDRERALFVLGDDLCPRPSTFKSIS